MLFAVCSPHSPTPWLLGGLLGVALQLQQPELLALPVYVVVCAAAGLGMLALRWRQRRAPLAPGRPAGMAALQAWLNPRLQRRDE